MRAADARLSAAGVRTLSLGDFEAHIADLAPAFRCYACMDHSEALTFTALVGHTLNAGAAPSALAELSRLLGAGAEPFLALYQRYDGFILYQDTLSDAAGVELYPVAEWPAFSLKMREELGAMGWEEADMPDWLRKGIAFGEIPQSANYFVVHPSGGNPCSIYYADHDDFRDDPIAPNIEALLDHVRCDPARLMLELGCYTRYSDGETDTQWIPKEYLADARSWPARSADAASRSHGRDDGQGQASVGGRRQ